MRRAGLVHNRLPMQHLPLPAAYASRQEAGRVWTLALAQMLSWGSLFYPFALLLVPMERELGLSRAQSSLAFSLALLAEGLLAYPVGRLIDRAQGRWVMAGGSVLAALCLLALAEVHSASGLYLCWLGIGAAMAGVLYTPAFAILTRRYPQDFRRAILSMSFLGGLASTVFIPLVASLIARWGWRDAVRGLALPHLLLCLPIHLLCLRGEPVLPVVLRRTGQQPLRQAAFWLVAGFVVLSLAVTAAIPAHLVPMLQEAGLQPSAVIALAASIGVLQVLGRLLLYLLEPRMDVHRSNLLIPCLVPLALLLWLAGSAWGGGALLGGALLFAALYGMGNGMLTLVKGTVVAQYVSREQVATLNGLIALPSALARAAAPLALGALWRPAAGYRHGVWLLILASTLGACCLWLAQVRHRQAVRAGRASGRA